MRMFDKLVHALKQIPPKVKNSPLKRNDYLKELPKNPTFVSHQIKDYKVIAYELWKIIEDIEKAEVLTPNDTMAYRSIVVELAQKRFVYMSNVEIPILKLDVQEIVKHEKTD